MFGNHFCGKLFCFVGSGAVADGDKSSAKLFYQFYKMGFRFILLPLAADDIQGVRSQYLALGIDDGGLTAGTVARVQADDRMSRNGLLQQQLTQVYGKYIDGLLLRFFRQFVPDLPLNGGKDQTLVGVGAGFCVHLGERVSFFYLQETVQFRQHFFFRVIQRKLQVFQLFPPVQGQGAVGRKLPHRFAVLFVHKEIFAGGLVCGKDGRQLGVLPQDPADQGPYVGPVRNGFRYNILGPFPGIAFRFHAFFSIDERRRQFRQTFRRVCLQHNVAG